MGKVLEATGGQIVGVWGWWCAELDWTVLEKFGGNGGLREAWVSR